MISKGVLLSIVVAGFFASLAQVQKAQKTEPNEQSTFGVDGIQIERPIDVPDDVLKVLRENEYVLNCRIDSKSPEKIPGYWFVGSEIHLEGPHKTDLVVQPRDLNQSPAENACLFGANIGPFWVFRNTPGGHELVLEAHALGLEVLHTRANGYRDIRAGAVVGSSYYVSNDYKFDGHAYQIASRSSHLIGADIPRDLSGYETRKPLVQLPGQDSAPILAQARVWIWRHWQTHKLSHLKISTRGRDGTEETYTFFINKSEAGAWQVILKVHRTVWKQASPTEARHRIIEDELLVADQVQRTDSPLDESHSPRILSEKEELPALRYRLLFIDYANRTVASL